MSALSVHHGFVGEIVFAVAELLCTVNGSGRLMVFILLICMSGSTNTTGCVVAPMANSGWWGPDHVEFDAHRAHDKFHDVCLSCFNEELVVLHQRISFLWFCLRMSDERVRRVVF